MRKILLALATVTLLFATSNTTKNLPLSSYKNNFYQAVNQEWMTTHPIPDDKSSITAFSDIDDTLILRFSTLIKTLFEQKKRTIDEQKILDFYTSYADMNTRNKKGIQPIEYDLKEINDVKTKKELVRLFAKMDLEGETTPYHFGVSVDDANSSRYMIMGMQNGITLEKKYYESNSTDAVKKRQNYKELLNDLLTLAHYNNPKQIVNNTMKVETSLAKISWAPAKYYNIKLTHNPMTFKSLTKLASHLDLPYYFKLKSYSTKLKININEPDYFEALNTLVMNIPLEVWKDYLRAHIVLLSSESLSEDFLAATQRYKEKEGFASKLEPLNIRATRTTSYAMSFLFGKIYIEHFFDEKIKAEVNTILHTILNEYKIAIENSNRLNDKTKKAALRKLKKMHFNIAYPDIWRDYSTLKIKSDDIVFNAKQFYKLVHTWELSDLKQGIVNKDEWGMSPQIVNAYYDPSSNKFNLMAAILNPPFFEINATTEAKYAGIGLVIGHEIGHAFDNSGAQYDENGNLNNWWSKEDLAKFNTLKKTLIAQANAYEILPGTHSNGAIEIGEIMADLSGAEITFRAYLKVKKATNQDKRNFFINFAKTWREHKRKGAIIRQNNSDPHPLGEYRINGTVKNMDVFYEIFNIKKDDPMYLAPEKRVHIWESTKK